MKLRDLPNVTSVPDYTGDPKHAHIVHLELFNVVPIRHKPRECSSRNQAVIEKISATFIAEQQSTVHTG